MFNEGVACDFVLVLSTVISMRWDLNDGIQCLKIPKISIQLSICIDLEMGRIVLSVGAPHIWGARLHCKRGANHCSRFLYQ